MRDTLTSRIGQLRARTAVALSVPALLVMVLSASAQTIIGYSPSSVCVGDRVTILGRDFTEGSDERPSGFTVRYGRGLTPLGDIASVESWSRERIVVSLPADLAIGTYWLAIFESGGALLSNIVGTLAVACDAADPTRLRILRAEVSPGAVAVTGMEFDVPIHVTVLNYADAPQPFSLRMMIPGVVDDLRTDERILGDDETAEVLFPARGMLGDVRTTTLPATIVMVDRHGVDRDEMRVEIPVYRSGTDPGRAISPSPIGVAVRARDIAGVVIPRHRVKVRLDDLVIHDDCDSVSPGDWIVQLDVLEYRNGELHPRETARWPGRGTRNVRSGQTYSAGSTITLSGIPADSELWIFVAATDCDADTPLAEPIVVHGAVGGRISGLLTWNTTCGDEELFEVSGSNDDAGTAVFRFSPEEWRSGVAMASPSEFSRGACGNAFTPHVSVSARPE